MNISCIECSSPSLPNVTQLLSTPEGIRDAAEMVTEVFDLVLNLVGGDYLKFSVDRRLVEARSNCPHHPDYNPSAVGREYEPFEAPTSQDSFGLLIALAIVAISLIAIVAIIFATVRTVVRRRHRKWMSSLSERRVLRLWYVQQKTKEHEAERDNLMSSLFASPDIPKLARWVLPVIILGNIGLFLSGHLSPAASVTIYVSFAGDIYRQDDFFEFSIANGTVNMWKAGAKELALLILLFSGVWPYAKQIISFVLWFLPPRMLSSSRRGNIYRWLDALAKWSMIDIFTLLVSLVAFGISVESPALEFLPEDFYQINLLVIPKLGLYANFIAQVVSQVSSHFILHYHDKAVRQAEERCKNLHPIVHKQTSLLTYEDADDSDQQGGSGRADSSLRYSAPPEQVDESLSSHAYARPHRGENDRLVARRFATPLFICTAVTLSVLVVLGCVLPSFSVEVFGLVGIAIEAGQGFEKAKTEFSLFTMVKTLFKQAEFTGRIADYVGLGSFAFLLIATVLVVPLAQTSILLYHWLCPMTRKRRNRVIVANEILQAWQYTEVYVLAILVGSWQLGSISAFMLNLYCDSLSELRALFAQLAFFQILEEEDAQCFRVKASVESAFFLLAAGSLLLAVLNTFVKKAAEQYLRDMEEGNIGNIHPADMGLQVGIIEAREQIDPLPVLFSDKFRWLLAREASKRTYVQFFNASSFESVSEDGKPSSSFEQEERTTLFPASSITASESSLPKYDTEPDTEAPQESAFLSEAELQLIFSTEESASLDGDEANCDTEVVWRSQSGLALTMPREVDSNQELHCSF